MLRREADVTREPLKSRASFDYYDCRRNHAGILKIPGVFERLHACYLISSVLPALGDAFSMALFALRFGYDDINAKISMRLTALAASRKCGQKR